jgi:predicted Zn-dependent protease
VLLDPVPAGLLMHEALGHRLEGNRMLSEGEGQTFRDSLNAPILPPFLSVRDDPRMDRFEGRSLVGHYSWDDEGVESQNVELVSRGVLKNFLTSRAGISPRHRSNGHGRNCRHERPISRMANTWIESHSEPGCLPDQATSNSEPGCLPGETTAGGGATDSEMKRRLIDEVRRQGLPYGIRILGATGGETATEAYNFQAFLGEIDLASRVFPDGREEWIRGVDFVGTPLNAVRNILAAGNRYEVDNAFCGAESGWVPVSTISPALLVAHLELQSKADAPTSRPCYPIPWASD